MRPNEMHRLARRGSHRNDSPKSWHSVPNVTGDYDFDATILHRSNSDMPKRLQLYVKTKGPAFGPRTAYNGYHGYGGDD
jgi:hypothetical protein